MDSVFAFKGGDYVCLVADAVAKHSILVLKESADRVVELNKTQAMIVTGDDGDVMQFAEYINRSLKLLELRQGAVGSVKGTANFIRTELATAIRRHPYHVNVITGGVDTSGTPQLYYIDYLGTMGEDNYCVQNYSMYFLLSVLSEYWRPDMTRADAKDLIKHCINALGRRFLLQPTKFVVKFVTATGIDKEMINYVPAPLDPSPAQLPGV
ncbi:Proteasome subunit beta type 2 [Giardia muris]|uniref:Proteasome subunit beta n=1 Tax=Giardia muris TaxID=5742 RepID=A0A4Z1TC86_GIAMU|nr:Proteasome subunit beta type 2 [Giardia muris]|eukprot:TNJ30169.1 Proteasome subunit beta type 2 [Giardia muris]